MNENKTLYSVVPCTGENSSGLALVREVMGSTASTPMDTGFWDWKHSHNPFGKSYGIHALDRVSGRELSLRMLMRWSFLLPNGSVSRAARAVDTVTHPDCQRMGLFSALTRQAVADLTSEGVHFIFNTPNNKSLPGYLKMGWQIVANWPLYIRVLRPIRFIGGLGMKKSRTGDVLHPRIAFFTDKIVSWSAFREKYGSSIEDLVNKWESARRTIGLRTQRDVQYLEWRYGRHPSVQYGIYPLEDRGQLAGFAIFRPHIRYNLREIVMNELFLKEPDRGLGKALMKGALGNMNGDYVIAHFAEESFEKELIAGSFFLRAPRKGIIFTVRSLNPTSPEPYDAASWDLTLGDLEIF